MKRLLTLLLLIPALLRGQDSIVYEGRTYVDTLCDVSYGVTVNRTAPVKFIFKNNSVTGCNIQGYMLEAGFEVPSANTENLKNEVITGNYFNWVGNQDANTITHGIFTGYNTGVKVMYNYLNYVPMGIIRKSNGLTDTTGVVAYNIIRNSPAVGVVVKGMNGVRIYNNTFYSEDSTYTAPGIGTWRGLIDVYTNTDASAGNDTAFAKHVKIKNNIFYTKHKIRNINVMDEACLEGFECDYNIYWCEDGEPIFAYKGIEKTFTQWQAMGYDLHSQIMNPHFINTKDLAPRYRLQWGTPTEFDMGIAMSDYWKAGFDPTLVRQSGYWQQGARIYEGDAVIYFYNGRLYHNNTVTDIEEGKITFDRGYLRIEVK